ncbi:hypothetical protein [Bradyrhizobium sp. SZCCHNRI2010]|uniref:hypothetical protein n=1 Tax=Bradyrhizobium sp. SZCCHNRI2010 TaxID=3057283 RepID=UPI0028E7DB98|nr:hypothetical protein [Bradyrhizobium sp. SZCCHNRI2010]
MIKTILAAASLAVLALSAPALAADGDFSAWNSATGQFVTANLHLDTKAPSTVNVNDIKTWPSIGAGDVDTRPSHAVSVPAYAKSTVIESDPSTWYINSAANGEAY